MPGLVFDYRKAEYVPVKPDRELVPSRFASGSEASSIPAAL